jgi:hypothetical protein
MKKEAQTAKLPPAVRWFFEKIAPTMASLNSILELHDDKETQAKYFAEHLVPHQENFVKMVKIIRRAQTEEALLQSIRMYGIRGTKNLATALRLSEACGLTSLKWDAKTGMLTEDPTKTIQYAAKTVEHFGEGSRYDQVAFNAGLILDLFSALAEKSGAQKFAIRKFIQDRHTLALKKADECVKAAKSAQSLKLEQHIISMLFMNEAGKIAMAMFFPDYLILLQKFERKTLDPALQHLAEMDKYSVSHNILGALICQNAPGLKAASKAVLFYNYPFLISDQRAARDSYDLITVCHKN